MGSVAKDKIGSNYINFKDTITSQTWLIEMGHPQPPTKLQIDTTTTEAFSKGKLNKKW